MNVQRSAIVFYLIIILLSEYVKACFYYFIRNTGFQMLQVHEVIFVFIFCSITFILLSVLSLLYICLTRSL